MANMKLCKLFSYGLAVVLMVNKVTAQRTLTVKVNQPGAVIEPTMWGIFFEDINMGADGGIYAELVKIRSFEFFRPLMGWTVQRKRFEEGQYWWRTGRR
jgi:hypothetical protein